MAYQFKAGILQRDSVYLGASGTVLESKIFNVADVRDVSMCYLPPPTPFNTDLTTNQQDGGRMKIGDPNLPAGSKLGYDFYYNNGSDFRYTRYFISANSGAFETMLDDATQYAAIDPIQGYTQL
jgi:hypothetical protein